MTRALKWNMASGPLRPLTVRTHVTEMKFSPILISKVAFYMSTYIMKKCQRIWVHIVLPQRKSHFAKVGFLGVNHFYIIFVVFISKNWGVRIHF